MREKRRNQDLHFLDDDGMVACNPRDREAAHRAEMEGIATHRAEDVTCTTDLSGMIGLLPSSQASM